MRITRSEHWENPQVYIFSFKGGTEISLSRQLLNDNWVWYAQYERGLSYFERNPCASRDAVDPRGYGKTFREALRDLRLRVAFDRDPKVREVYKKMIDARVAGRKA